MATNQPNGISMVPASRLQKYWDLITFKTIADMKAEAERTYFGYIWWFVEPLLFLSVYYLIFGVIMKSKTEHFLAFLFIGLVTWRWFHTCAIRGCRSIEKESGLMQQIFISKLMFPITSVLNESFKFIIVFTVMLFFIILFKFQPNIHWLALPLILLVEFILIMGVVNCFAAITPFIPDFPMIAENILRSGMFVSGVFFDISDTHSHLAKYLKLNPMADLLINYRQVIIENTWPHWNILLWALLVGVIFNGIGIALIRRNERIFPKVCL